MTDLTGARWVKSTRSASNGQCVEVARNLRGVIGVRDSKDLSGPALSLAPAAWAAFTAGVQAGTFDQS